MEVINTDLKKYLGKTITILMNDGTHERIKVVGIREFNDIQTLVGGNDEGLQMKIKSTDMAMIYPMNGVM